MVDYKLRLGDGTTFSVDEKGLTTWLQGGLVDDKARIQPAGSKKWFTLKQVLAAQGEQRGHAVRQTEEGRADVDRQAAAEVAEIEKRVAEQRAAEERRAAEELAAAERKAIEERTAAERKLVEDREAAERYVAAEAAEEAARAAAAVRAAEEQREAERAAAEEKAAAERSAAEAREAERNAEAEMKVAAERAERAERKRKAEEARVEAERVAAETAREAAVREAERVAEAERQVAAERAERAEKKRRAEADRQAAEKQAAERLASERLAAERLAAERAAAERGAADRLAAERAADRAAADRAADRAAAIPAFHVDSEPPATAIPVEPAATMVKVEDFERELGLVPVAFDERSSAAPGAEAAIPPTAIAVDVPLADAGPVAPEPRAAAAIVNSLIRLVQKLERVVTWIFRGGRATPVPPAPDVTVVSAPGVPPVVVASAPPVAVAPPPKPAVAPASALPPWAAPPPAPWSPQATTPAIKAAPRDVVRKAAMPPPSHQNLDVIPFAAAPAAPKVAEQVWDGEEVWEEPSRVSSTLAGIWRWTVRATILTGVVGAALLLAFNKEKWVPQAQDAATVLGQGVDKLSERASSRTVSPQAIEAARGQIPYLRPQTIEMIVAKSPVDLEPAEVFRRAHVAAERARSLLPANVAAEIDNLTAAAAGELDAAEGERLRGYLGALRAGTPTAAYQDKDAIWLMSRGARRLSAEKLSRMEELFAQAVSAALRPPTP